MDWTSIPSLSGLKAFEAAARLGSLSLAAKELNVTHAAIAQHVRSLETEFGIKLLERSGRGMIATRDGRALSDQLAKGFDEIAQGVRALRAKTADLPLNVTATFTFSENWLMPRLPDFWAKYPKLKVSISPSMDLVDLQRDGYDLGIRFGRGDWKGLKSELIIPGAFSIVATPKVAKKIAGRNLGKVTDIPWLRDVNYPEPLKWLESEGFALDGLSWHDLPSQSMMLAALRAGGGISAVNRAVLNDDLKSGRLKVLHEAPPNGQGYYLISHKGIQHPDAAKFRKWILATSKA